MRSKKSSIVSNAGPLIHLAKTGLLHLLKELYGEVVVPYEVKVEVVDLGKEKGFPDALEVENAIREGWIRTEETKPSKEFARTAEIAGLRMAEIAVVYFAHQKRTLALLDDEPARVFARTLRIPIRGSLGTILESSRKGLISSVEALEALDRLSDVMYLDPRLYRLVRKGIERIKAEG